MSAPRQCQTTQGTLGPRCAEPAVEVRAYHCTEGGGHIVQWESEPGIAWCEVHLAMADEQTARAPFGCRKHLVPVRLLEAIRLSAGEAQ